MSISGDIKYIPAFHPPEVIRDNAWVLAFIDKKLLMIQKEDSCFIPDVNSLNKIITDRGLLDYIGRYGNHDCYCISLENLILLPEELKLIEIREITALSGDAGLFRLAGTANHILQWKNVNRYCGKCGNKMKDKEDERAKVCSKCGNIVYPRISPATITAILKGDQILLAHNHNFREGLYSLIAGFVEPGETLEECVEREIREEVGIKVKNIKYFSSQPWPFPDSLMLAFTAEYESGEIKVDQNEIIDAGWYKPDSLPDIPSSDSVAGKIIRWYRDQYHI